MTRSEFTKLRGANNQCDSCEALMINGVYCHETGCPNTGKRLEDGEWVAHYECRDCGFEVREGEACSCMAHEEEDE